MALIPSLNAFWVRVLVSALLLCSQMPHCNAAHILLASEHWGHCNAAASSNWGHCNTAAFLVAHKYRERRGPEPSLNVGNFNPSRNRGITGITGITSKSNGLSKKVAGRSYSKRQGSARRSHFFKDERQEEQQSAIGSQAAEEMTSGKTLNLGGTCLNMGKSGELGCHFISMIAECFESGQGHNSLTHVYWPLLLAPRVRGTLNDFCCVAVVTSVLDHICDAMSGIGSWVVCKHGDIAAYGSLRTDQASTLLPVKPMQFRAFMLCRLNQGSDVQRDSSTRWHPDLSFPTLVDPLSTPVLIVHRAAVNAVQGCQNLGLIQA
ncbi:hypothetical protein C8R45DRAFT_947012 [Mycena sanguinolenta]|nr:hypothetical protein C8R45DRAFT_947012 [Mycena sanguinolenta]